MQRSTKNNRPAVFLDRDGTVIAERHYLARPDQIEILPGADAALRSLAAAGFALVLITNQSGIARGLYADQDFHAVQARLRTELEARGVQLDGVYYCPHHPDITGPCPCRKPGHGLYLQARMELGLDLTRSAYVGDRVHDVQGALDFGGLGVLVETGYGAREKARLPAGLHSASTLLDAAAIIVNSLAIQGRSAAR